MSALLLPLRSRCRDSLMVRSYLALGGNVGKVEETFRSALRELDALPETTVGEMSPLHRFSAVGQNAGADFQNGAVWIETQLAPLDLLRYTRSIENRFGRSREMRWSPRPLDIDLILYGEEIIEEPELLIPHPACWYRRFVLDPLVEIGANAVHPGKRTTMRTLRDRLLGRPLRVALAGSHPAVRADLITAISAEFAEVDVSEWQPATSPGEEDPALLIWLGRDEESAIESFESLPLLPRLDASSHNQDRFDFLCNIIFSALGD